MAKATVIGLRCLSGVGIIEVLASLRVVQWEHWPIEFVI